MKIAVTLFLSTTLFLIGCRGTVPINNPPRAIVSGKTVETVENAIMAGIQAKRWTVVQKTPGNIRANLYTRGHEATVDIKYDKDGYGITYVDSKNLHASGGEIHAKYNKWVNALDAAIRRGLF